MSIKDNLTIDNYWLNMDFHLRGFEAPITLLLTRREEVSTHCGDQVRIWFTYLYKGRKKRLWDWEVSVLDSIRTGTLKPLSYLKGVVLYGDY